MIFKHEYLNEQFKEAPRMLQKIALDFAGLSDQLGVSAVVTRVFDHVPGSSGVHEAHRAIDFRDEFEVVDGGRKRLYTEDDVHYITSTINQNYPRTDGKLTCIHHSFNGGPMHFHLQIGIDKIDA